MRATRAKEKAENQIFVKLKTLFLYRPQGKEFIIDIVHDLTGQYDPPKIITGEEAIEIMNKYPEGIMKER